MTSSEKDPVQPIVPNPATPKLSWF